MDYNAEALRRHRETRGKMGIVSRMPLETIEDLSIAYTPGVGAVSLAVAEDTALSYEMTNRGNTVAVVSDGSAVLGLGNIGPEGAMPVMEGKAILFKELAGIDAFPICLATQSDDEIVETVDAARAQLRRRQPRGHLGATVLRHRGAPPGHRHPRLPRRPARNGGRHTRRAAERAEGHRQGAGGRADRLLRRRRLGRGLREDPVPPRRQARDSRR